MTATAYRRRAGDLWTALAAVVVAAGVVVLLAPYLRRRSVALLVGVPTSSGGCRGHPVADGRGGTTRA
ncbi:hypothetical protein DQ238_02490 [Geodermatophilus sp. TF02-6]|uniref:hypothetical protein n=1 Tax=Geodermatophilus sp. TF02-6 TaxID=2250575 RepID=UPI000DE8C911|nr:hypothetical protein [Geodermatophilus sp. TF02-6]RBY82895.1 hypothetical protein DQ238_02490 [Geodermatophilus sp. TF02-6]